jgi:tetratricopeptide (TPR) repeat protein
VRPSDAAPLSSRPAEAPAAAPRSGPELRLAIGRQGAGLELGVPVDIGCVRVLELEMALPGTRFPLDVSGGVRKFRHRRGRLDRLVLEVGATALARFAAPRLSGLLGPERPEVVVVPAPAGLSVGIVARGDAAASRSGPVLAFDVVVEPRGPGLALHVLRARGLGLPAPAPALALAAVASVLGPLAARSGARFLIADVATTVLRALLPEAGARVPDVEDVVVAAVAPAQDAWILHSSRGGAPHLASDDALRAIARARETTELLRACDDALVREDADAAREAALSALERAPRHVEAAQRVAAVDLAHGGRTEAALATLEDAERAPFLAYLAGELREQLGEHDAAAATLAGAADAEPIPVLAATAWTRAAELSADPVEAVALLDRALVRSPRHAPARWARVARRLAAGRLGEAMADVEHLEALARGARAKHAVWRAAGDAWCAAGLSGRARPLYERALRWSPDDPEALMGLARVLLGQPARAGRALALMVRAVELAEAPPRRRSRGAPARAPWAWHVEVAEALAQVAGDRPAAIARVRAIPDGVAEAPVARGLEGRWRAELGDVVGAGLAYARLRDAVAAAPTSDARVVALLLEAAAFEERRADPSAAQAHLAVALRARPTDPHVLAAHRAAGAAAASRARTAGSEETTAPSRTDLKPALDDADAEAEIARLTDRVRSDPGDDDAAERLAQLLARLGRAHELLALLWARMEDASEERRKRLVPRVGETLEKLEAEARRAGRDVEAALYADARAALELGR